MKGSQLKRLVVQHLLPHLPGFFYAQRTLYRRPVFPLLRGIGLDSSSYTAEGFYLAVFVMPLCSEPIEHITLSHGKRLTPQWVDVIPGAEAQGMSRALEAIAREAVPYLDARNSLADFTRLEHKRIVRNGNPPELLELGCSYVFLGESDSGLKVLQQLIRAVDADATRRDHDVWRRDRAHEVVTALSQGLPEAQATLERWSRQTVAALKLE